VFAASIGAADLAPKLEVLRERGSLSNSVTRSRRADGTEVWLLEHLWLHADPEETIEGVFIDITDKQSAAEQVRQQSVLLGSLVNSLPDPVFYQDVGGRFLGCNDAFEVYTGRDRVEFLGEGFDMVFAPDQAAEWGRHFLAVSRTRTPARFEQPMMLRGRERRSVEVVLTPLFSDSGQAVGVLGIGRDVTERQRREEKIRETAKMEAIGRLAGGVAHDFNNLLTVLIGNIGLAIASPDLPAEQRALLMECDEAGKRASELTRQLLGFARRSPVRFVTQSLAPCVAATAALLRRSLDPRIALHALVPDEVWPAAIDATQLEQVLINLALNARDAMPDGGSLSISAANLRLERPAILVDDPSTCDWVRLRVADSGYGIPEEIRSRIFEPFFTTKEFGKGTGLGLAMVQGIVRQHRGWVECRSEPGRGTTFDLFLPRAADAPIAVETPPPAESPVGRGTVLVVDDEKMIRDLCRAILERGGYNVLLASDGQEGLDLFDAREAEIDLILLDMSMPRLSGVDCLRRILAARPSQRVLLATGFSKDIVPSDPLLARVPLILKPYRPAELLKALADCLAS
jgi:PAS domain S-box-containing protein